MKLKFDPSLPYQQDAVAAVVDVFTGQPFVQAGAMAFQSLEIGGLFQTELGMGNRLVLPDDELLKNVHAVQEENRYREGPRRFRDGNSPLRWRPAPARRTSIFGRSSS